MMSLVIGPNSSGKSVIAERIACEAYADRDAHAALVYLATMIPSDDDGYQRVIKHRRQREGLGFITVESPLAEIGESSGDVILLEDVSNLVANLTFGQRHPDPVGASVEQVRHLRDTCFHLVAVTIGGLVPEPSFGTSTNSYITALNEVNTQLRDLADFVIDTSKEGG